jgi:hypothetical protein
MIIMNQDLILPLIWNRPDGTEPEPHLRFSGTYRISLLGFNPIKIGFFASRLLVWVFGRAEKVRWP